MCMTDQNLEDEQNKEEKMTIDGTEEEEDDEMEFSNVHHPLSQISMGNSSQELNLTESLRKRRHLINGKLSNGLEYVILPNKHPPGVIEVRVEIKAGSINEEENEQGLAHFLEHVVFLGTEKFKDAEEIRRRLADWGMTFGPDANAYTDFRNTVYELIVPVSDRDEINVREIFNSIEFLKEVTLKATFPSEVMEIEKQVVLSECTNFQSPDQRIFYQNVQQIHGNNILAKRFPIGIEEQIRGFTREAVVSFYKRFYRVDNMVLYVCGTLGQNVIKTIEEVFGPESTPAVSLNKVEDPPVTAATSFVSIFQIDLATKFSLQINQRSPLRSVTTLGDLREDMVIEILDRALEERIDVIRHQHTNPPFTELSWSYFEDTSMNCMSLDSRVVCRPSEWREALKILVIEFHRLALYGLSEEEMKQNLGAILKDGHDLAEQNDTRVTSELISEMMDSNINGSIYIDVKQQYRHQMKLAPTISLAEVNAKAKSLFSWISSFTQGQLSTNPFLSIFVSAPLYMKEVSNTNPNTSNAGHSPLPHQKSPSVIKREEKQSESSPFLQVNMGRTGNSFKRLQDLPTSSPSSASSSPSNRRKTEMIPFVLTEEDVLQVINNALKDVEQQTAESMPSELVDKKEVEEKFNMVKSHLWIPPNVKDCESKFTGDGTGFKVTSNNGVILKKLWNGMTINLKQTQYETRWVNMQIHARGGTSLETADTLGCASLGMHTFINGGAGGKSNEEIAKYCNFYGIVMDYDVSLESVTMDFGFSVSHEGGRRVFELVYLFLTRPDFRQKSFDWGQKQQISQLEEVELEVENIAYDNLMKMMFVDPKNGSVSDKRFHRRDRGEIESVTLEKSKAFILEHFVTENLEISLVGDFEENEIMGLIERFLGIIPPSKSFISGLDDLDQSISFTKQSQWQNAMLEDDEVRGYAFICFPSHNRWTSASEVALEQKKDLPLVKHPLYCYRVFAILGRLLTSRLFSDIREKMGLTYDIGAYFTLYEHLNGGLFVVSFMAFAEQFEISYNEIMSCIEESKLKGFNQAELDEVIKPTSNSIRTSMSTNSMWITLLSGLQRNSTPKNIECTENIAEFYEKISVEDVQFMLNNFVSLDTYCVSLSHTQKPSI
eukprot:TRINITY_DN3488_c0_g1_i1.p1 TRINITY_DN3488_c0_g1~~TRINITY_DN3488_c0_g1_i1.p1  ORF type:complete len:1116 (-),score=325.34 TRINITY_DN3488_c0_g1_i1:187-3534(-)